MSRPGTYDRTRREIEREYGELLERGEPAADLSRYEPYRDDPVAFIREVLGDDPWGVQEDICRSVRDHRKTVVPGANAVGKDYISTRIAAWWAYSVGGLAIITGPTEQQCHEVIMRKEMARAKAAGGLPGDLYTEALRIRGDEASIITKTAVAVSGLTGFHGRRVLGVLTEAQGVPEFAWEALQACATGPHDRLLAVGNPIEAGTRFHRAAS